MFDNIFQLIWEVFLTFVWYVWSRIKDAAADVKNRFFHRDHKFIFAEVVGEDGESALCTICKRPLSSLVYHVETGKPKFIIVIAALISAFASPSRADNFVGATPDSVFLRDSVYVLKVAITQSTCDAMKPCTMQIAGEGGSGTVFKNLFGNIGDTLSIPYNFPATQFAPGAVHASLFFFGSDGKTKDIWTIRLGYKDPKPSSLGIRRRATGFRAPVWNGLINGRTIR